MLPAASPATRAAANPAAVLSRRRGFQRSFFCPCGEPLDIRRSCCRTCTWQNAYSRRYFGGLWRAVLERDGMRCRTCGSAQLLHVHHRRPGLQELDWLVTLCAGCHARVHRLHVLRNWLPPLLVEFWEEQHPATARQLQFALEEYANEEAAA